MRKISASLALALFSSNLFAGTQIIFSKSGDKATISILAFAQNIDAAQMYEAIAGPPKDEMGKLTKRIDFSSASGAKLFDISCVFSKIIKNNGSCILVLHASPFLLMNPAAQTVRFELQGLDAEHLALAFVMTNGNSEIYHSSDNLLILSAGHRADGSVDSFTLTYGQ